MPKGQRSFGHQELAEQLSKRLQAHFSPDSPADASLVIGVFGEWGSGKSNLLYLVDHSFNIEKQNEIGKKQPPVIVVPFNPWRYEKEEHLLVPLLKNMELVIEQHIRANESFWTKLGLFDRLKQSARFLGVSSLAFLQAFKAKLKLKDVAEIEFDIDKFIKEGKDGLKKEEVPKSALDSLESYYFEFEHRLCDYTTGKESFRLLFLIDDLDRCLPEKAVEMLESIKLFLDVEGCAFVLALDDEVVERGIIHRYRDYIFQGNGNTIEEETLAQMPITGPEYLEKIINLPFRLPQPSRLEIRQFLRKRFPDLFDPKLPDIAVGGDETDFKQSRQMISERGMPTYAAELLNLFVNHIPPVPRKQIRTAELVLLLLDMAKARNCEQKIKPLPLAKLTLLQLFAPDLYRFGRRRYRGVMQLLQEWSTDPEWGQRGFSKKLQDKINLSEQDLSEKQQIEVRNFDRYYSPILKALETAAHNRSGFDPFNFIKNSPLSEEDVKDLRIYFSFVDEATLQAEENKAEMLTADTTELVADLTNDNEFLDLLFGESASAWQSAMQMPELEGRVLSSDVFDSIIKRLDKEDFKDQLNDSQWLTYLIPHLSINNFNALSEKANKFESLIAKKLPNNPSEEECEDLFSKAELFTCMSLKQQKIAGTAVEVMRQWLTRIVKEHLLDVKMRAKAGRLLSEIGDSRFGVTVKKDNEDYPIIWQRGNRKHQLPEFDWQKITAGTLEMGFDVDEGDDDSKPKHKVEVQQFFISRYPVTNAQYRCFLEAGVYDDNDFWDKQMPQAASLWLQGEEGEDNKLIAILKDKDMQKQYKDWLKADKERYTPRFWNDKKWNLDNHPVVGVSWFEAFTYSVWLNEISDELKPSNTKNHVQIALPTEAEWEYAARGQQGFDYACGDKIDSNLANYNDTGIGRTSTVGLFPAGKAFNLHDMSGNTWEWSMSRWGANLDSPDFSYEKWKSQEGERNLPEPLDARIIRGGSFDITADDLRCAIRNRIMPINRGYNLGFRVCCVS